MDRGEAARVLGVDADAGPQAVRAAYRRLLLRTHPDVSAAGDATLRTVRLTEAFTVLSAPAPAAAPDPSPAPASGAATDPTAPHAGGRGGWRPDPAGPPPERLPEPVAVALVDGDTIGIGAPPDETLLLLLEAAHRLGEIAYLDRSAGLLEVVVEFVEAPTSSVLLSLQGRATGVTDVFCTVEPLSGGDAPPADAVTRLVLATLLELHPPPPGSP